MIRVTAASAPPYQTSHIKRHRSTKAEVQHRRNELYNIVARMHPMTVRQVFYQATVLDLVEKTEAGYNKVQTDLVLMRDAPASCLMTGCPTARDCSESRDPSTGLKTRSARLLACTGRPLWADADCYVEIWIRKRRAVWRPLSDHRRCTMCRSWWRAATRALSFLHGAAEYINEIDVPTYIYHLGDYDPSGVNAGEKIDETLRELAPDAAIHFERIAVTPEQIRYWRLPTRPTKTSDTRAKGFGKISVELDAIEPARLRQLVEVAIESHFPAHQYGVLKAAEESERSLLLELITDRGVA